MDSSLEHEQIAPRCEHIFSQCRHFAECHASTIVSLGDNRYLVAFFAGSKEGNEDTGIYVVDGSAGAWSQPRLAAKVGQVAHWNPVLHMTGAGRALLFFKVGFSPQAWRTWLTVSDDGGRRWSQPRELVPGSEVGRGPVKNKLLVLSDGSWLAPASVERDDQWDAFVDRSTDAGVTWGASPPLPIDRKTIRGAGVIQPTLWESAPGYVHMLLRSTCGRICRSDSDDFGLTWTPVYQTELPNNNSGIDLVKLADGKLILLYNPVPRNWGERHPLSAAVSADNGETWKRLLDLETEEGEFSYPAIINVGEGIAATYTWHRKRIAFWRCDGSLFEPA